MRSYKRIFERQLETWALIGFAVAAPAQVVAEERTALSQFVQKHCLDCHAGEQAEAGFRLDAIGWNLTETNNFRQWVSIYDRVQSGEMPPRDAEQPAADLRRRVVQALKTELTQVNLSQQKERGRTQFRRLNREEYQNTLRDLLASPHLEVSGMLPADQSAAGFDNVGAALELSQVHMRRYLDAASFALEKGMVLEPPPSATKTRLEAKTNGRLRQVLEKHREAVSVGNAVGLLRQPNTAQAPWWWSKFEPPIDGQYRIRMKTFGFIWDKGKILPADRTHVVTFQAVAGTTKRSLGSFDIGRSENDATVHDFTAFLRDGDQLQFWLETLDDRNKGQTEISDYTAPGVAVEWLEVEGPLVKQLPTASYARLFGDLPIEPWTPDTGLREPPVPMIVSGVGKRAKRVPAKRNKITLYHVVSDDTQQDARRLLVSFAERAFRRPVKPEEIEDLFQLVQTKLDQKFCFQEALRVGFQAALCSPDFLFLREEAGRLDDYALASRLSYFLWQSLPDEELLTLAEAERLENKEVLRQQVERMLGDPRSQRFIESFCGQWLDLRRINITQPDERLYPEFDQLLLDSMVKETKAYFAEMLRHDLSIEHLIDSKFVMINGRLAELYDIPDIDGVEIRRVKLPSDSARGGLLTQASVLKVTANGTTTSPVTRGAWVLDRIYGQPAPLPPSNVSAIEPDLRGTTTIREQLDRHRNIEACAVCHRRIDPPGFAMESFDVIGGWRGRYRSLEEGDNARVTFKGNRPVRYKLGLPVDTSGVAPNGQSFNDIHEFRQILLSQKRQIATNLTERLLTYATGAGIQFADRQVVERILAETDESDHGLRSVIHAVVQSEIFQRK